MTQNRQYHGKFNTDIRFKFLNDSKAYYSNSIKGSIELSQFEIPATLMDNHVYNNVLRVSDKGLAERVMFLQPKSMEEFMEKNKKWIEQRNKKNKGQNK